MLFTQIEFIILLLIVVSLLCILKSVVLKKTTILVFSMYFYAYFDYRFLLLLIVSILLTYISGNLISRSVSPQQKKTFLALGVLANISSLFFFKYYNFFVEQINNVLSFNEYSFRSLAIIVPLGISFYTFRFISYQVDVYRGNIAPCCLFDFLIYGFFFPVIISGPITRATRFIPQLKSLSISKTNLYHGYRLFVIGLFLKVFVADRIAYYVNYFYSNYEIFDTTTSWLAITAYSIQIYCDFAGYSSMAIGIAYMLGVRIEENFNYPYLADNIQEFWKKWHITLSEWIRDYLYIPLGGSRKGTTRKYINLLIVMTLCGFWHGSSWTFVLWGALHGLMLIVHSVWQSSRFKSLCLRWGFLYSLISKALTFLSVTICWVFFRASDLHQAVEILKKLFLLQDAGDLRWMHPFVVFIVAATLFHHILKGLKVNVVSLPVNNKITPAVLFCLLWLVVVFFPKEFEPFVYLQF